MGILQDLKVYVRSGSWGFARSKHRSVNWSGLIDKTLNWKGHTIAYRPGTSDQGAIYEILLRSPAKTEYFVDRRVDPRIILDVGANIGITTIWLKKRFPNATIYAFEPMPENFRLLQKNTEQLTNVSVFPFGLGAVNMRSDVYGNEDPNNRGAFSIYSRERGLESLANNNKLSQQIEIRNAGEALVALGIDNIDLLKIDTEGSEYDIISSLPQEVLKKTQWIMGELHGIKTYGVLNILEPWFATEFKKAFNNELFTFFAINRNLLGAEVISRHKK